MDKYIKKQSDKTSSADSKWIPINLPEDGIDVLLCDENEFQYVGHIYEGEWEIEDYVTIPINEIITAWQPLPESYHKK